VLEKLLKMRELSEFGQPFIAAPDADFGILQSKECLLAARTWSLYMVEGQFGRLHWNDSIRATA
jgi:hypothetical protein